SRSKLPTKISGLKPPRVEKKPKEFVSFIFYFYFFIKCLCVVNRHAPISKKIFFPITVQTKKNIDRQRMFLSSKKYLKKIEENKKMSAKNVENKKKNTIRKILKKDIKKKCKKRKKEKKKEKKEREKKKNK
ncbi:hypothetical protein RFI_29103, partial [Reticulomyxa filosa]